MNIAELLRKKRYGKNLSSAEIEAFITGVTNNTVNEAQAAAFCMAACTTGLNAEEISALTLSMAKSGDTLHFSSLPLKRIDKHSTGGVGDKLSLLLVPLVAACGVAVPMMSGRGLGHTGGTVDKLSSIPGFRMSYTNNELNTLLQQNNCFMIQQTETVAPADRILYQIRDVTGTVESVGLITASILSKKLVEDLDGLVLDMKVGNGAFMQTLDSARQLAESMMSVARQVGLGMTIVFTNMNQPLGNAIGNWLEMKETEESLRSFESTPNDIRLLTVELAARMLMLADAQLTLQQAQANVKNVWNNGSALQRFYDLISQQNGDWNSAVEKYSNTYQHPILATESGYVSAFLTRELGLAAIDLEAGRKVQTDTIDYSAGIILHKKIGDAVEVGEPIATVYGKQELVTPDIAQTIMHCISIAPEAPTPEKLVLDVWEL